MGRRWPYLLLLLIFFSSCFIEKRLYRRGWYAEGRSTRDGGQKTTNYKLQTELKSQESKIKGQESRIKNQELKIKAQESGIKSQESKNKNQESKIIPPESQITNHKSQINPPSSTNHNPRDPFSTVTLVVAIIVSFFIPPLGLWIALGNIRPFRINAWICLVALLFLGIAIALIVSAGTFLPGAAIGFLYAALGLYLGAIAHALFRLLSLLFAPAPQG